jgi:hypothetical protein
MYAVIPIPETMVHGAKRRIGAVIITTLLWFAARLIP